MHGWKQPRRLTGTSFIVAASSALVLLAASHSTDAWASGGAGDKPAAARAEVNLSDVWARATPAGARMGAIYLKITSPRGDRLLRAAVPRSVAAKTQIHETIVRHNAGGEGSMEMHEVSSVELPPNQVVELAPGGFHVMLMDLKRPLKPGDKLSLTLRFEKAGSRTVTAEVRGL